MNSTRTDLPPEALADIHQFPVGFKSFKTV